MENLQTNKGNQINYTSRVRRPYVSSDKEVDKYPINKIISLDETSIQPSMIIEYSRCSLGKRCIVKTDDSYLFRKFTLLVAISNSKCIGWTIYEKGGMTKERLVEFLEKFIFNNQFLN